MEDNRLAAFLGIRYILSGDGNPDESEWKLLDKVGSLYIHENALEADTAHFYTTAISEDSLRELCAEETRDLLLEGAIALEDGEDVDSMEEFDALISGGETENGNTQNGESADVGEKAAGTPEEASYVTLDAPEKDSRITGSIHAENEGYALFMIPYEDGWDTYHRWRGSRAVKRRHRLSGLRGAGRRPYPGTYLPRPGPYGRGGRQRGVLGGVCDLMRGSRDKKEEEEYEKDLTSRK